LVCVASGPGVALAACPACEQYVVNYPTVRHKKHTTRHRSKGAVKPGTTTTATTETSSTPAYDQPPATGVSAVHTSTRRHHKNTSRGAKKPHKSKPRHKPASSRRAHALTSKRTHGAARLTVAAATGSGGGIGVWLLVILGLVLVSGSTAGILRYRRTH
jgi:cobalamin biosynthesis Mg chelatase CobN